jgi:Xaa-Pro aminopeptidase
MERLRADRVLVTRPEHVQYLTGFRPHRLMGAAVLLDSGGRCVLVAPNRAPESAAADEIVTFEAQWHYTLRQDQRRAIADVLRQRFVDRSRVSRIAIEYSNCGPEFHEAFGAEVVDIEPELWSLRRCKFPDELAIIRRAIACTDAMYARARSIIEPGITEIEVFNQLHAAAVEVSGEPLTDLGNDYQSNSPGGPPRPRRAEAGELFILDLGPAYRGYHADNCRTFLVGPQPPSDAQQRAWQHIVAVLDMIEHTVRPSVRCRDVFDRAQTMLDQYCPGAFYHHLGHGIGLFPHEAPHLNPRWDDTFSAGDVFTAEPGLYGPELRAGIRIEQDYFVTESGVERLTSFPVEL